MQEEVDVVKLPSKNGVHARWQPGNITDACVPGTAADLHLIASDSLNVPLVVERQSVDLDTLEEHQMGDSSHTQRQR
jgi:hypothetical protein